jgi:hypothetical protein
LARHAKSVDGRLRAIRLSTVSIIWLGGLAAGFFGLLGAAAKYGCASGDNGFGCRTSGSVVGILLVIAVIAVVIAVTVLTHDRPLRRILVVGIVGLAVLALCFAAAQVLLATA